MHPIFDDVFWWQSKEAPHAAIDSHIRILRDEQSEFYDELDMYLGLYGGRPLGKLRDRYAYQGNRARLTYNIVHSICQSATSKIAKHRPSISFLTSGGDWSQQRKGKLLQKFMQGQLYATKAYSIAQEAFLDACITGTGVLKIFVENEKVKLERVPLTELTIDTAEASSAEPRQIFQTKTISRHVLAAKFPDNAESILWNPQDQDSGDDDSTGRNTNMIQCHEAWHLPSGPDAEDGRHIISVKGATLLDEEYTRDHFPFTFVRWTKSPISFWGNGLVREVKGIQVEINKLLAQIQEQMHLATPKVFVEESSKIVQAHLNNRIWGVVKYRGTPPQFFTPRPVSGEAFQQLDRLIKHAYELTGISQLSAQSKKPVGLDSGRALREFSDIESERFMVVGQDYESAFVEITRQVIEVIRDAYDAGERYSSMSFSPDSGIEHINWREVNLEDDQYIMQIQPIGSLPQTPAAKLSAVMEGLMNGLFTPEEAHRLLEFPDIEQNSKLRNSPEELIDKIIDDIIDKNKYTRPEPFFNLELGIERFQLAYQLAIIEGVPEERLEQLRRWMKQAMEMLELSQPEPAPMPGMGLPPGLPPEMGGVPGEMPMGAPPGLPPGLPPGPPGALPPLPAGLPI